MKKILALLTAGIMITSLTACGKEVIDGDFSNTWAVETNDTTTTPSTKASKSDATQKETEKENSNDGGVDSDFKEAMDSYENFMDEYVDFMKKYQANSSDLGLLTDYADYTSKYADFVKDFEKWEDEDMNADETEYYIEVQSRVSKKLLEVAQ